MTNKYLKPMLDPGSPRVFNCNIATKKLLAKDPNAALFFHSKPLNTIVLIKDTVPAAERAMSGASVGTKLYFPFNIENIYEGGRTIFLHEKSIEKAIIGHYGETAIAKETLDQDMRILGILDRLPSLDPFLMKDAFIRNKITIDDTYFQVSAEAWDEIVSFMLQQFEPLVKAAFPDDLASDDRARALIDKIWEAQDAVALRPLIDAFRLPPEQALEIFASWRGIVYYSFQYQRGQAQLVELLKWLKENETPASGVSAAEIKEMGARIALVRDSLRAEWKKSEDIVRDYQTSYDKIFKLRESSADFLNFLKKSNKIYWEIGNSLGKANHACYCWDVMTSRFKERKVPWQQLGETMRVLASVFEQDKPQAGGQKSAWG